MSVTGDRSLFIRVIDDGRIGTAFTNDCHDEEIISCLRRAKKLAHYRAKDGSLKGFTPRQAEYRQIGGLYDKAVATMELPALDSLMDALLTSALDSTGDISVTGSEISAARSVTGIINSNGVDAASETSTLNVICAVVCGKGDKVSPECLSHAMSRSDDLSVEKLGRMGAEIASSCCNEVEPVTEECAVVLSPMAAGMRDGGLLTAILTNALSGMQVLHEGSPFVGRLGEEIASRDFTMKDAPLMPGRVGSRPFDDEGTAARDKWLVRDGVLEGFVWDQYHGSIEGSGSTGNAVRNPVSGAVVPAPMNLTVSGGGGDLFDLVSEIDREYLQRIVDGHAGPALVQDVQHRHAVLAAGEGHQYPVPILDQVIVVDRLPHQPPYFPFEIGHPSSTGHPVQRGLVLQKVLASRTKRA